MKYFLFHKLNIIIVSAHFLKCRLYQRIPGALIPGALYQVRLYVDQLLQRGHYTCNGGNKLQEK